MRSLATKPSTETVAARKPTTATATLAAKTRSLSTLSTHSRVLQRQCACGGGCPSCKENLTLQTKLKISEPGDEYEQEADRIANQVMQMPEISVPRSEAADTLQRKAISNRVSTSNQTSEFPEVSSSVNESLNSPGQPLDPSTRTFMETRFGHDFSGVRVHADGAAERSAQSINANAYTVGHNIVFDAGQFAPSTHEGRRLIAHELTHVVQQSNLEARHSTPLAGRGALIQRQKSPQPGTAGASPKLDLQSLKNGTPCACLVVIHNNERKARQTAQLMHQHCAYNLLLMEPDDKSRELGSQCIDPKRSKHPKDPNECFPAEIAEQCINDEASCETFLKDNAGSKKEADIMKFMQISFFLSIKKCSNDFSLPVVALHNNDIEDTRRYLTKKDAVGVSSLKQDVDKSKKETGEDKIQALKDEIDSKFGKKEFKIRDKKFTIRQLLMDTAGKTNIFRWCASDALSKCHIGDPDHPDKVVWVTNQKDFDKLSKKDINVALQSDASSATGTDAGTDLSTIFLVVQEKLGIKFDKTIRDAEQGMVKDLDEIVRILLDFADTTKAGEQDAFLQVLKLLLSILKLSLRSKQIEEAQKGKADIPNIRFLNIETPHNLPGKTDQEVSVGNYEFIVEVLKNVGDTGLHCCGKDAPQAEKTIKQELEKGA